MASLADILNNIRDEVAEWMFEQGYGNNAYLAEAPIDEIIGQYAVQIILSQTNAVHPNSGVGLMRTQVDFVVWWRGHMDSMQRANERIAGDLGIQKFVDDLREHMTQRMVSGMTVPLLLRSGGVVEAPAELDGWLMVRDNYDFAYLIDWEVK